MYLRGCGGCIWGLFFDDFEVENLIVGGDNSEHEGARGERCQVESGGIEEGGDQAAGEVEDVDFFGGRFEAEDLGFVASGVGRDGDEWRGQRQAVTWTSMICWGWDKDFFDLRLRPQACSPPTTKNEKHARMLLGKELEARRP